MPDYKTEAEFLKDYNPGEFDRPSVTSDILIFSVSSEEGENWRRTEKKKFSVLLVHRDKFPFKDKWNLPGGFMGIRETAEDAAKRVLLNETGLRNIYIEQLYTFDDPRRDPRMRIISVAFMALVDKSQLKYAGHRNADFFDIKMDGDKLALTNDNIRITEKDLAFDHAEIINYGINRLRNKIEYTDIVFNMMPHEFTLGELQQVYEAILGKKLLAAAFRRIIANKVIATGKMRTGGGHRPSQLFRYKA
ncbi:MAG: NUDIX hydrolase [Alphaproteobacteria bacterium]|nr:NUDIX hydrolase [Alphaproteobacteria bacterium]